MSGRNKFSAIVESDEWSRCLAAIERYDFYHTYSYHELSNAGEGEFPLMLCMEQGTQKLALPLIIRDVKGDKKLRDATSVYGYAGPISSHDSIDAELLRSFGRFLREEMSKRNVVSVFSRMHPLFETHNCLQGIGELHHCGHTISIDLSVPEDEQVRQYSSNHRRGIKKLQRAGVVCERSSAAADFEAFKELYSQSMKRVNAADYYFFDDRYFANLMDAKDYSMNLFVCRDGSSVLAAGLFSSCGGIVQYHLGATATEFLALAPSKLMFHMVRQWATGTDHRFFHLGGGVGGRNDSLFAFKNGFAKNGVRDFRIWKWIVDREKYDALVRLRFGELSTATAGADENFFPLYRA